MRHKCSLSNDNLIIEYAYPENMLHWPEVGHSQADVTSAKFVYKLRKLADRHVAFQILREDEVQTRILQFPVPLSLS